MRRHRGSPHARGAASPLSESLTLIRTFNSESNPSRPVRPSPLAKSGIQDMPLDMIDRIRSFPLFQSAPETFLSAIGAHLRPQLHAAYDNILTEGEAARAMYWLVRGAVAVTSRDGESTYAELKPGAFFGEIGVLMNMPRTATIIARSKCLLLVLKKEDLGKILPAYPEVERAIRDEAQERLAILESKKKQSRKRGEKRGLEESANREHPWQENQIRLANGEAASKRRKSPSPGLIEAAASSALGSGSVHVRQLLRELPLFTGLPPEILHFLGLNVQHCTFHPFTDIIKQGTHGKEVFFIIRGEVEVIDEEQQQQQQQQQNGRDRRQSQTRNGFKQKPGVEYIKARLRQGNYFGEVVSLSLAPKRTATVRSVNSVECLVITGQVLEEFWKQCPTSIKTQVEQTARHRLKKADENDVVMTDEGRTPQLEDLTISTPQTPTKKPAAQIQWGTVDYNKGKTPGTPKKTEEVMLNVLAPADPFALPDIDGGRSRSRRSSLAPPQPESSTAEPQVRRASLPLLNLSARTPGTTPTKPQQQQQQQQQQKKPKAVTRQNSQAGRGPLPDKILVRVLSQIGIRDLMRFRRVSRHWDRLLRECPEIAQHLDLSLFNKEINDDSLRQIAAFVGSRPRSVDLDNCFHITDEGFSVFAVSCCANVRFWRMRSVWEVSAGAIHEMVKQTNSLEHIDLSNCRKANDALLMHVIGNLPPPSPPISPQAASAANGPHGQIAQQARGPYFARRQATAPGQGRSTVASAQSPARGAAHPPVPYPVVPGAQRLHDITLSYCKHVTDRTMAHLALFARHRLTSLDLTRCTTITDAGFDAWGQHFFPVLHSLVLADCTYLSDSAIISLANAAPNLRKLDLSFCCALSDAATEVIALGCTRLEWLSLAFCGSAVSDSSLQTVGMHLAELRFLSVRGCVRVTGVGVEAVVEGCRRLCGFDVSQCRNLLPWLDAGGRRRVRKGVRFEVVAGGGDGAWR